MTDIREQIEQLRDPLCQSFNESWKFRQDAADTMEKMLAVVEAGQFFSKTFNDDRAWDGLKKLREALAALEQE